MKVAVIKPYYFPYIKYFELVKSVDKFIFYDSAPFPFKGYVNKNKIYSPNKLGFEYIDIPISFYYQKLPISSIFADGNGWLDQHKAILEYTYKIKFTNHPIQDLWNQFYAIKHNKIMNYSIESVRWFSNCLGIHRHFCLSSTWHNKELTGQDQIIHLVKAVGGDTYVTLNHKNKFFKETSFASNGLKIEFLPRSPQKNHLSILDHYFKNNLESLSVKTVN